MITTVLKDIDPGELGFCQSHEHLFIRPCPAQAGEAIDCQGKSLEELSLYRRAGGNAIVDAQPIGTGRDAAVLALLSEQGGVHIIALTGFHKLCFYPNDHWVFSAPEDKLFRLFTSELTEGMYTDGDGAFPCNQTKVKAGLVKTALDTEGLTPPYQKLFKAAAAAAKAACRPLMAHIEQGSNPLALADFLENEGLSPDRVIFCHLDRAIPDTGVHRELCRRGIYLEYDTIGRPKYHDDIKELGIITEMLEAGHGDRLLMGLDTTRTRLRSYGGIPGLCYIIEEFIPFLWKNGISEADTRRFFIENPRLIFDSA